MGKAVVEIRTYKENTVYPKDQIPINFSKNNVYWIQCQYSFVAKVIPNKDCPKD